MGFKEREIIEGARDAEGSIYFLVGAFRRPTRGDFCPDLPLSADGGIYPRIPLPADPVVTGDRLAGGRGTAGESLRQSLNQTPRPLCRL